MVIRPVPRKRGLTDVQMKMIPVHLSAKTVMDIKPRKFVPIQDIEGYVEALRKEGFYTDEELAAIEKKHRDVLPPPKEYPKPAWTPRVSSTDQVYVKLVVGQTKVKVIAFHPYAPLYKWWRDNPGKPPPIEVRAEYHLLLGMPKEMVMKMVKNDEKNTVKTLKPVIKTDPVF